jgi:hypothetical protein
MNIEISHKDYEKRLNWNDAMLYCQLLVIDGKDDWRMPTKEELNDIYKSKKGFDNFELGGVDYWSSTECDGYDGAAWYQYFTHGAKKEGHKSFNGLIRPVRTIKPS